MRIGAVADHQRNAPRRRGGLHGAAAAGGGLASPLGDGGRAASSDGAQPPLPFAERAASPPTAATGEPSQSPGWPCCRRRSLAFERGGVVLFGAVEVALGFIGVGALGVGRNQHAAGRRHDVGRRFRPGQPDRFGGIGDGAVEIALGAPDHRAVDQRLRQRRVEPDRLVDVGQRTVELVALGRGRAPTTARRRVGSVSGLRGASGPREWRSQWRISLCCPPRTGVQAGIRSMPAATAGFPPLGRWW